MDDLINLDWPATGGDKGSPRPNPSAGSAAVPASLRGAAAPTAGQRTASPVSSSVRFPQPGAAALRPDGGTAPAGRRVPAARTPAISNKGAGDSFADLLSIGTGNSHVRASGKMAPEKLSLQERQKMLQKKRMEDMSTDSFSGLGILESSVSSTRAPTPQSGGSQSPMPGTNNPFSKAGSAGVSPKPVSSPLAQQSLAENRGEDLDDILAAFDSATPVDTSSHLPPPPGKTGGNKNPPTSVLLAGVQSMEIRSELTSPQVPESASSSHHNTSQYNNSSNLLVDFDDEFEDISRSHFSSRTPVLPSEPRGRGQSPDDFVHVGSVEPEPDFFGDSGRSGEWASHPPPTDPRDRAIAELVDMGFDPAVAVSALSETPSGTDVSAAVAIILSQVQQETSGFPPSSRQNGERPCGTENRADGGEGDIHWPFSLQKPPAQLASELGSNFIKSANTWWKAGQRHIKQAVADLQVPGAVGGSPSGPSTSQPRWMSSSPDPARAARRSRSKMKAQQEQTEEGVVVVPFQDNHPKAPRDSSPFDVVDPIRVPGSRDARDVIAETPELLFAETFGSAGVPAKIPTRPSSRRSQARKSQVPAREIPNVSYEILNESANQRRVGNEAFKVGNYELACQSFGKALASLPEGHPLTIVIRCNRAATALKTGDSKGAIADADAALATIGPGRGHGEQIEIDTGTFKEMLEFYGRALNRKAQALEHLERWADAAAVWQKAVEAGVAGSVGMAGRQRCLDAASMERKRSDVNNGRFAPQVSSTSLFEMEVEEHEMPVKKPVVTRKVASDVKAAGEAASAAALEKQRQLSAKAAQVESEKFALHDTVEARVLKWAGSEHGGRNLRALLATLDQILWPGSGWKPVGMAGLVLPKKAKIAYMKALTVVHPDKVPSSATIEQKMIAESVFTILNSAWDKFKDESGLK